MPATAGRVRMPANNRVHSSAALQTHGIWQSAIGYDPYAPTNKEDEKGSSEQKPSGNESDAENAYANFQGLLALARVTGSNADVDRGACKRCGRVGHLKFQCKNLVKIKEDIEEKDPEAIQLPMAGLDRLKGNASKGDAKDKRDIAEASDEEDESESSDSDEDPEIERILAERYGKKLSSKKVSSRKKRKSDEHGSDTDSGNKKRGRSKNRRSRKWESDDSDDSGEHRRKRRKEKRRKRAESSDEDDERRRRHRKSRKERRRRRSHISEESSSEGSESSGRRHRHKSRRHVSSSDSDSSGSDDLRTGRNQKRKRGRDEDGWFE